MFSGPVSAAPTAAARPFFVPSLPGPLPEPGQDVVVMFAAGRFATGTVREVDPAPLGGLLVVDLAAADPRTGRVGKSTMTVPGWCVHQPS